MDRAKYSRLVETFFQWNPPAVTRVFEELLNAAAAEQATWAGPSMSQNYETAQANPEIHMLPGNLKDARDAIFPYFWGTDSWNSPLHLENVRGPANQASLIGAIACLLKNPNLCTDRYSQRSNELEVKAITALANLIFYHTEHPWGVFTIGGTISNLYGAKIGIEKVVPNAMRKGLAGDRIVGICSSASHYSNLTIAGWLGLGTEQLIEIPTDANLSMRLDLLAEKLDELYRTGTKVAYVSANFGTTDGFGIDDIAHIRQIVDEAAQRFQVPSPQLHVDAAVGWAITFLADYDINANTWISTKRFSKPCVIFKSTALDCEWPTALHLIFIRWGGGTIPVAPSSSIAVRIYSFWPAVFMTHRIFPTLTSAATRPC